MRMRGTREQIDGQVSMFDWMAEDDIEVEEPDVGAWVETHGAVICHIMLPSYIGRKVVMDKSTQSHKWYKVGLLESVRNGFYYHGDDKVPCDIAIVYDGGKQRNIINMALGGQLYECLPFHDYPKRERAIFEH